MSGDKRILLWGGGAVVLFILLLSILAPAPTDADPRPSTYNSGTAGTKAAYLMLQDLGYHASRWNSPPEQLAGVDAAHTTLVLAEPFVERDLRKQMAEDLKQFLERGGRVLLTGVGGATLLPGGRTSAPTAFHDALCDTTPEGQSPFARAGQVSFRDEGRWNEADSRLGTALHVEQRCGDDAVVVRYAVGAGEAIWWSSSMPLSNGGLKEDASLRLLLASVGAPGRTVLFDEFAHGDRAGLGALTKGLPLKWLAWQLGLIALLLVLSFSRRKGPLRMPVTVPRTSPVEFAESMGHLYERAGATNAATGTARRKLWRFLIAECGVARATVDEGPAAIAETLQQRLGGDWSALQQHLTDAAEAERSELTPRSALALVRALDDDEERLRAILSPQRNAARRETIAEIDPGADAVSADQVSAATTKE